MSFATYLAQAAEEVDQALDTSLSQWESIISERYPLLSPFIRAFIEQCRGGKRVRGALVKLGYGLSGGNENTEIIKVAVAFEIFQTAILSHDDIIDRSELRRGKPSLYQALGGDHYGISQAISLSDLGFFLATEMISKTDFPYENKNKALTLFTHVMQQTALGEIMDVYLPTQKSYTEADILTVMKLKTSPYTIIGPLSVGALLGGGSDELLTTITEFGENLGIAYQIHDDILGIFGEEETLGKSVVSDITEGKSTHLYRYALEHGQAESKQHLSNIYGKPSVTPEQVKTIQDIFKATGAYDYASGLVKEYSDKACSLIPRLTSDDTQQALLLDIAKFLIERNK
jgi:geranylgeranyl diphosphate synthase, type I